MDCVLILFQRKLHPIIPDTAASCPKPSWAESLKVKKKLENENLVYETTAKREFFTLIYIICAFM